MIRSIMGSPNVYVMGRLRAVPRRADAPGSFLVLRGRLRGTISPGAVSAIASAIQTQEGYYPGSLAYQNNNPGNLVYVGQPGASPGAGGFASFSSYAAGQAALQNQIMLDATRGTDASGNPTTTIAQLIGSWAPPSENDTAAYIASVASQTGFDVNAPLSSLDASDGGLLSADTGGGLDLSGLGLADELSTPVDLSAIGAGSVPVWGLIAAGIAALLIFGR